ncbi:hypothetical protein N7468_000474 [Penicillium chermesinum]|uniref:C2H2-type domain-containing protein n=1 Tax=Penicillium chermesinum TaxID=63820 RepID=A0A9W9PM45_9EURO|nr:uncharacterized protein N7468_000474 [Penicillium chermesinum]KAJ5249023.1 hypothetical protein N7468_000474 [Penicillium chermesinum]KAJ6151132.1 hypothetical protein N7470_007726 [Penicillium chermesinum]
MSDRKMNVVSILNNDDNPSFAVRSNPRLSGSSLPPMSEPNQPPPVSNPPYVFQPAMSESPATSPKGVRHPRDSVNEVAHPTSPSSSDGSAYDYVVSQSSSVAYHPYARQDLRRDSYSRPRGPAPPRTPPEAHANVISSTDAKPSSSSASSARGTGRKNKYPCPYAASHGCTATFTTSGHAARHGKKHTGEKSVHCPICNKAFTRKDNMKQHIRTHRTHSEDMRSISTISTTTSEPDAEPRWIMSRPDSGYATTAHPRTSS